MPTPQYQPTSLWIRLLALLYDLFLLFAVGCGYVAVVMLIATSLGAQPEHLQLISQEEGFVMQADAEYQPLLHGPLFQLGLGICILVFYIIFWRTRGATLGMQTWRLVLVDNEGKRPPVMQCALRGVAGFLSLSCFGIGYLWILVDREKMALHDRVSRTRILRACKR